MTPMKRALPLLLAVLGNYLPKTRYNYVMGVRTPWTLSDERVWDQTHRLAGPLMMAGGVVVMGGGLAGEQVRKLDFQATFPNLAGKDIKQLRFKFSDSLYEKSVPFEIKDIKLP